MSEQLNFVGFRVNTNFFIAPFDAAMFALVA